MEFSLNHTAHFDHDCNECRFIASLANNREVFDIYLHGDAKTGTIIARDGSEGPEYHASPMEMVTTFGDDSILSRAAALVHAIA